MGAIADTFVAYAQPLIDQTDGSEAQLKSAFAISQLCFNLSLVPEDSREEEIRDAQVSLEMDDREFDDFRRSIVDPMIRRHQEMFPQMHRRGPTDTSQTGPWPAGPHFQSRPRMAESREPYPGTDRYAPCPCNSGRKYKFCCAKKPR